MLKEDWPRWQEIDSQLPPYERWLEKITQLIAATEGKGVATERVTVDPEVFAGWCKQRGKPVDRNSRAQYAAEKVTRRTGTH